MTTTIESLNSVLKIKVPSRAIEEQPCLAFASIEIGQFFQKVRGLDGDSYRIIPIEEVPKDTKVPSVFLVFTSGQQVLDVQADPEGYEYERLIMRYEAYAQ